MFIYLVMDPATIAKNLGILMYNDFVNIFLMFESFGSFKSEKIVHFVDQYFTFKWEKAKLKQAINFL